MELLQRQHIATVMQVASDGTQAQAALTHDEVIRDSWHRCVHEHRLDPTRMQEAVILPSERLREHQDQLEAFLHIARHGLETLYQQVAGMGYVVLLTAARAPRPRLDGRPPAAPRPARRTGGARTERGGARALARPPLGNLRELRNVLDYARSVAGDGLIDLADLPDAVRPSERRRASAPAEADQAVVLLQQLRQSRWNVSAVARAQGLSRMTLYRRMKRWGIASPNRLDER